MNYFEDKKAQKQWNRALYKAEQEKKLNRELAKKRLVSNSKKQTETKNSKQDM